MVGAVAPRLLFLAFVGLAGCAGPPRASDPTAPSESASAVRSVAEAELARERWNRVFAQTAERGVEWVPSRFLVEVVEGSEPGRALDVGMGQGRNALYLAEAGWRVAGFDLSDEGIEQARRAAAERGLELDARVGSLETWDFGTGRYDLIVVSFLHELILPRAHELVAALRPGGLLVVEGFHREAGLTTFDGAPFGYRANELLECFGGLRVLRYEELETRAEWARRELKRQVRFLGQRDPDPTG